MPTPQELEKQLKAKEQEFEEFKKKQEEADKKRAEDQKKAEEELNERLEKVRKEEKEKIYSKIEKTEKEKTELETRRQEDLKKIAELESKVTERNQAGMSEAEKANQKYAEIQKQMEKMQKELEEKTAMSEVKIRRAELNAFKEKCLRDAGNNVIPELVAGDNEDAILASVKLAKDKYEAIKKMAIEEEKNKAANGRDAGRALPPGTEELGNLTPEDIKNMDADDWAKNREKILKAIQTKKK